MVNVFIVMKMCPKAVQMLTLSRGRNGGLGVEENVVTLCPKCHFEEDFGQDTKLYEEYIENYLKGVYGENWSKEKLIYNKWR